MVRVWRTTRAPILLSFNFRFVSDRPAISSGRQTGNRFLLTKKALSDGAEGAKGNTLERRWGAA